MMLRVRRITEPWQTMTITPDSGLPASVNAVEKETRRILKIICHNHLRILYSTIGALPIPHISSGRDWPTARTFVTAELHSHRRVAVIQQFLTFRRLRRLTKLRRLRLFPVITALLRARFETVNPAPL